MRGSCYPSWRYHSDEQPRLVCSKEEDDALGPEWSDTPAAFINQPKINPPIKVEIVNQSPKEPKRRGRKPKQVRV